MDGLTMARQVVFATNSHSVQRDVKQKGIGKFSGPHHNISMHSLKVGVGIFAG